MSNKDNIDTPGTAASTTASPLIEIEGIVAPILPKELSFSPASSSPKTSPPDAAGRLQDAPVAPEATKSAP
eukprot:SAG11_NODE_10346_length_837_cov_387.695122_1_plen_70_part_10